YCFSSYKKADIESLVTLRNGLLHDGSLLSINKNGKTNVLFRVAWDSEVLLKQPKMPWDGQYSDDLTSYTTIIDLKELQKLVKSIIDECNEYLKNNTLEISIKDKREFYYKYLFS
ncbi:MAG: hypothetical protein ACI8WB_004989, partial [Phenylobacterium sp.]